MKRFGEPADLTYFSYKVSSVKLAANLLHQKRSSKQQFYCSKMGHVTCSSNFATAKAVRLTAIWLAALELNLQQQNTVKLAEILPQRNWSSKQLFCYSEKQSSKQQFRLQQTFLSQNVLALI